MVYFNPLYQYQYQYNSKEEKEEYFWNPLIYSPLYLSRFLNFDLLKSFPKHYSSYKVLTKKEEEEFINLRIIINFKFSKSRKYTMNQIIYIILIEILKIPNIQNFIKDKKHSEQYSRTFILT
jgi:hypothetical protein